MVTIDHKARRCPGCALVSLHVVTTRKVGHDIHSSAVYAGYCPSLPRNVVSGMLGMDRLTLGVVGAPLSVLGSCFSMLQLLFGLLPSAGKELLFGQ